LQLVELVNPQVKHFDQQYYAKKQVQRLLDGDEDHQGTTPALHIQAQPSCDSGVGIELNWISTTLVLVSGLVSF
jgi:hypothetical protein